LKILIYGAGAVGLAIANCLLRSGNDHDEIHIVARPETVSALRLNGLLRTGILGEHHAHAASFSSFVSLNEIPSSTPYDSVLVCTKSFDSASAARDLANSKNILNARTNLILFQNGWGNKESVESIIDHRPIYTARVITGFRRPAKHHTDITVHADAVRVGSLDPIPLANLEKDLSGLCDRIDHGGLPCKVTAEVGKDLWAKILYNCALNPLGAIFGVSYGTLADYEPTRNVMNEIFDEIYRIMNSAGHVTHWPTAAEYRDAFYGRLVPTTYAHHSSTLQDIRAKKRTEIDALNGAIVALGERHGLAAPVNRTMHQMVKFLEAQYQC